MNNKGVYICSFIILPNNFKGNSIPNNFLWKNLNNGLDQENYS